MYSVWVVEMRLIPLWLTPQRIVHICSIIIVLVAAIDTYWLSKNRSFMISVEQNPIGQYLIHLDDGDVSIFILCKMIGTYTVICMLYAILHYSPKHAIGIATMLALAQLTLLYYLYWWGSSIEINLLGV